MGKYFINLKSIYLQKLMNFLKQRKKSELIETALLFYLKNVNANEIQKFINPIFSKEFEQIIKKIKEEG